MTNQKKEIDALYGELAEVINKSGLPPVLVLGVLEYIKGEVLSHEIGQ